MNKLWAGRSEAETSTLADAFNSSIAVDGRMYQQDITGSMAHAAMLAKCGILTQADADQIIGGLAGILADLQSGALRARHAGRGHPHVRRGRAHQPHR